MRFSHARPRIEPALHRAVARCGELPVAGELRKTRCAPRVVCGRAWEHATQAEGSGFGLLCGCPSNRRGPGHRGVGNPQGLLLRQLPEGKEELGREALTFAEGQLCAGIDQLAASASTPAASGARSRPPSPRASRPPISHAAAQLRPWRWRRRPPQGPCAGPPRSSSAPWEGSIARGLAGNASPGRGDRELASEVLILIEGVLIMARVRRTTAPLRDLDRTFARLLRR
jgi:hypothetical protein